MKEKSFYDFETLEDVIVFFCDERDIQPADVKIGGAFGGPSNPTPDDDPTFFYEE
jgi:hypothetical protein